MPSDRLFSKGLVPFGPGELRFWTVGRANAPWLAVLHGGGLDHASFRPVALACSDRWRVLLWDLPGHGQSQPMPRPFSARLCADALAAVLDGAGVPSAVLLGFSFGGVVAQLFAKSRPDRVDGLVAYGCFTPHLLPPLVPKALVWPTVMTSFGAMSWPKLKSHFAERCSLLPEVRQEIEASMEPVGKRGFLAMAAALLSASDHDPEFRIRAPLALIAGEKDSNGPPLWKALKAFETAYPHALAMVIPDAGHCAHQDRPALFEQALTSSLESMIRPASPAATALGVS